MLDSHASLLKLFLPEIVLENFELMGVIQDSETFHFQLEERNNTPEEWGAIKVQSKGFFPEIQVQDFPIRGHKVFYHIKRRRWMDLDSKKVMYRDWTLVKKGTRMTGEFAAFLKQISQYSPE
jgi:hypothetical protein